MQNISLLPIDAQLRIGIGAGNQAWPGWIASQGNELNLLRRDQWETIFGDRRIDALLCEHVLEHLTEAEGRAAATLCYDFLKPGGYLRCAVPDANFRNEAYQRAVQAGGPGSAADHKLVYDYGLLSDVLTSAGFVVDLLEYCDDTGRFHFNYWDPADGPVGRSVRSDTRNQDGKLGFVSLIVDAKKPYRPPLPPFTPDTAAQKARSAEDAWNTRDPERVASAYTEDSRWRNRAEFFQGREAIIAFLGRKWTRELEYRLIKEVWAFRDDRIAVRFAYEWRDDSGHWFRSYGNENWEFDAGGFMAARHASINDLPIAEGDRRFHWPPGRRPDDHPGLSVLGL